MPLWRKLFGESGGRDGAAVLDRRVARFRHLLNRYGAFLDVSTDAAEKQAGDYVFDRHYIVTVVDAIGEAAEAMLFDLSVLVGARDLDAFATLARMREDLEAVGDPLLGGGDAFPGAVAAGAAGGPPSIAPGELATAIARHALAYHGSGRVACRGVAAGMVLNRRDAAAGLDAAAGSILVATDISPGELDRAVRGGVAGLLLDDGSPTCPAASVARRRRIPSIVGLHDATRRLRSGEAVTVDADEGTVYFGIVRELVDYYRAGRLGEEEPEYRTLRAVRRAAFGLTLGEADAPEGDLAPCRTVHDLVVGALEAAGDALAGEIANGPWLSGGNVATKAAGDIDLEIVELLDAGASPATGPAAATAVAVSSRPLAALLGGLGRRGDSPATRARGLAAIKREQALAWLPHGPAFDLVDGVVSGARALNHVYVRIAARFAGGRDGGDRGALACRVLERFGFAAMRTPRSAGAWVRGLGDAETEERLVVVGRLVAALGELEARAEALRTSPDIVEELVGECGLAGG
jgi:phosphohistidine swiveling domain-containing protein